MRSKRLDLKAVLRCSESFTHYILGSTRLADHDASIIAKTAFGILVIHPFGNASMTDGSEPSPDIQSLA